MLILGIETSCDETAAAIVEDGYNLHSSILATSLDIHIKYGGVVPDKAAREQLQSILPVIQEALSPLATSVDAIAVTYGPGLIGSLLIGVETAKTLSLAWNKPLIPVNHLVGHIYGNWITQSTLSLDLPSSPPEFPALVLIVSGGHSDLLLMKSHTDLTPLGSTRDDAAGECFDKCGRLLNLPYPYGPYIEKLAANHEPAINSLKISLPRPLIHSKDYDFSFSGLKTAFLYEFQNESKKGQLSEEFKESLAHELQEAVTDVLVAKTLYAAKKYSPKSIVLAGGVAANKKLREKLHSTVNRELGSSVSVHIPPIKLCTDNAAVIASAAFFHNSPKKIEEIDANPGLTVASLS